MVAPSGTEEVKIVRGRIGKSRVSLGRMLILTGGLAPCLDRRMPGIETGPVRQVCPVVVGIGHFG